MPAREVSTGVTGKLAEHKFILARNAVSETNLPARRRTIISTEAILDEKASLHAERNEITIEQHVAIQHRIEPVTRWDILDSANRCPECFGAADNRQRRRHDE